MKIRKAANPDALRTFFDNPGWTQSLTRPDTCRMIPCRKWNGVPVDPRIFSRFDISPQVTEPQNLETREVILGEPEKMTYGLHFSSEEQGVMDVASSTKVATQEQLPFLHREDYFENYQTHPTHVTYVPVPASLALSEGPLLPTERRERLTYEVRVNMARKIERRAQDKNLRRAQIMQNSFPLGILGVDGPRNANSTVYKEQGVKLSAFHLKEKHTSDVRRRYLKTVSTSDARLGYNFLEHNGTKTLRPVRDRPSTQGANTHGRLFNESPIPWSLRRAQHLRNNEQAGRPYNIVNGGKITVIPPTTPEKHLPRQAHPSLSIHGFIKR